MKTFLLKIAVWTLPGAMGCFGLWFGLLHQNPSRDTIGLNRMMPTSCQSMIFGTSRSAQGVNPDILNENSSDTGHWFNFSFNLSQSPWNDAYVDAIIEKITCSIDTSKSSHFLIFVDPWTLDEFCGAGERSWFNESWAAPCGSEVFKYGWHNTNPLDVLSFGSCNDLLSVMASTVPRQFIGWITQQSSFYENSGIQDNGWLPNKGELTLRETAQAIKDKVSHYETFKIIGKRWPYSTNADALVRLIDFIHSTLPESTITLIRPPVTDLMLELEDNWFPETNSWLRELANKKKVQFVDANEEWTDKSTMDFKDAHHLTIPGANRFSDFLAMTCLLSPDVDGETQFP